MRKKEVRQGSGDGWIGRVKRRYASAGLKDTQTVVLRGREEATVHGCHRILSYSPQEICFGMKRDRLTVTGERLYCSSFVGGTVTVMGRIDSFAYGEGREKA